MTTLHLRKSIGRSPWRRGYLLIPLALAWFALSSIARAVDPAPDGGYPGNNTAEGTDALLSLTTGVDNTPMGFDALHSCFMLPGRLAILGKPFPKARE